MKKFFFFAVAAIVALSSCNNEEVTLNNGNQSTNHPTFTATIESTATRTALGENGKVNWENGDEVLMMFGIENDGASAVYIYEATPDVVASSATLSHKDDVMVVNPNADKFVMAIYPASLLDMNAGGYIFPATQTYNGEDISFAPMFSMSSFLDSETPNNIVFKNGAALLKITVPHTQMANLTSITVSSDLVMNGEVCFDAGGYMYIGGYPDVTSENSKITLNIPSGIAIPEGESKTFYIAIPPMSEQTEEAQADHYDYLQIDVTDGTTTKSMRTNKAGGIQVDRNKIYPITFAENYSPAPATTGTATRTGDIDVNWVQLWPGGPKFAEYNVGAANNKPEDYGYYYTWGGSQNMCITDNCTLQQTLTGDNDTATKLWGSAWRMPTIAELDYLINGPYCSSEWVSVNGVSGMRFTGKDDYSGNSVFFPAAGYCSASDNNLYMQTTAGYYWSSSQSGNKGYRLILKDSYLRYQEDYRTYGYSVRPVLAE